MRDYDHLIIVIVIAIVIILRILHLLDDTLNYSLFLDILTVLFFPVSLLVLFSSSSADLMVGRKNVIGENNLLLDFF